MFRCIIEYTYKSTLGIDVDLKEFETEQTYYKIFKEGLERINKGVTPSGMDLAMEFMKQCILNHKENISEEEILEVILSTKLMKAFHLVDLCEIFDLVKEFGSQKIHIRYAKELTMFSQITENSTKIKEIKDDVLTLYQNYETQNMKTQDIVNQAFHAFNIHMHLYQEVKLIDCMIKLLEKNESITKIKEIFEVNDEYIKIVLNGVQLKKHSIQIALALCQAGQVNIQEEGEVNEKTMSQKEWEFMNIMKEFKRNIAASYETKWIKIIRENIQELDSISVKLPLDEQYIEIVKRFIEKNPYLSDEKIALKLLEL